MSDDISHGSNADARISRAETGDHGKRPAKVVLWIGIPFLIIGGIIFLTSGGITPALILGVVLALTGGALRDRAARSEGRAAPPEMQVPPMLTWPTSSSRPDLFRYRGADYSLGRWSGETEADTSSKMRTAPRSVTTTMRPTDGCRHGGRFGASSR
jgi:hypothetical protein